MIGIYLNMAYLIYTAAHCLFEKSSRLDLIERKYQEKMSEQFERNNK